VLQTAIYEKQSYKSRNFQALIQPDGKNSVTADLPMLLNKLAESLNAADLVGIIQIAQVFQRTGNFPAVFNTGCNFRQRQSLFILLLF